MLFPKLIAHVKPGMTWLCYISLLEVNTFFSLAFYSQTGPKTVVLQFHLLPTVLIIDTDGLTAITFHIDVWRLYYDFVFICVFRLTFNVSLLLFLIFCLQSSRRKCTYPGSGVEINWLETGRTGGDPQPPCVHWRSTAMGKT